MRQYEAVKVLEELADGIDAEALPDQVEAMKKGIEALRVDLDSIWIVVEVYQSVVNEVRAYETEELAKAVATMSFGEHLSAHQANENDCWILQDDAAKEPYGSCPCDEYDILVFESPIHRRGPTGFQALLDRMTEAFDREMENEPTKGRPKGKTAEVTEELFQEQVEECDSQFRILSRILRGFATSRWRKLPNHSDHYNAVIRHLQNDLKKLKFR